MMDKISTMKILKKIYFLNWKPDVKGESNLEFKISMRVLYLENNLKIK